MVTPKPKGLVSSVVDVLDPLGVAEVVIEEVAGIIDVPPPRRDTGIGL